MRSPTDTYALPGGIGIPCIGFGTWQTPDGEVAQSAVRDALLEGYRHIDTAAIYGNERSVGRGIKESGVPREDIFVTTKLWNNIRGYDETLAAFETSLGNLGVRYLDLYLIHWPNPPNFRNRWREANAETWKAFEDLLAEGRVRAIGVSNFHGHHLDALMESARTAPMVNQIKLCPGVIQEEVTGYCRDRGIVLEAYSPLGTGAALKVPEIVEMAEKYQKTAAQLLVRWSLQMGFLPLPKSTSRSRIKENADVFNFSLSEGDVARLAGMTGCCGRAPDPDSMPF